MSSTQKVSSIQVPKAGEGVRGILIGDPCIGPNDPSVKSMFNCAASKKWDLPHRFPQLVNKFIGDTNTQFWGLLGDNFYDRTGDVTDWVYSKIDLNVKKKLFVSVLGNHDYWLQGAEIRGVPEDQCGNGFVQYYGLDMKSAKNLLPGDGPAGAKGKSPYDLSIDPAANRPDNKGCNFVKADNTFYYHSIGNVGVIGYSAVYPYDVQKDDFVEACDAFWKDESVDIVLVLGHWNKQQSGATEGMAVPDLVSKIVTEIPGCTNLFKENRITFAMGHEHCNYPAKRRVKVPMSSGVSSIPPTTSATDLMSTQSTAANSTTSMLSSKAEMSTPEAELSTSKAEMSTISRLKTAGQSLITSIEKSSMNLARELQYEFGIEETKEIPGFTLGSFGLEDFVCPDQAGTNHTFGIPVFDTTGGKFRVYYFLVHRGDEPPVHPGLKRTTSRPELYYPLNQTHNALNQTHKALNQDLKFGMGDVKAVGLPNRLVQKKKSPFIYDNYESIMKCIRKRGSWLKCTHLAMLWHEQDLPPRRNEVIYA